MTSGGKARGLANEKTSEKRGMMRKRRGCRKHGRAIKAEWERMPRRRDVVGKMRGEW